MHTATELDHESNGLPSAASQTARDDTQPLQNLEEDIKVILCTGLSKIPYAGAWISALIGLLWPLHQPSLWDQIKDQVAKLIDDKIESFYENELRQTIAGLRDIIGNYLITVKKIRDCLDGKAPRADLPGLQAVLTGQAAGVHDQFTLLIHRFTGASEDTGWKVLPLYVHAANLHLAFLADFINRKNAADVYGLNSSVIAVFHDYWKNALKNYEDYVDKTMPKASAAFESERAKRASEYEDLRPNVFFPVYDAGIATGAWYGQREFNAKNNQYTLQVRDYRELWKSQQDPTQPPAGGPRTALTRELWYGPYGAPFLGDFGNSRIGLRGGLSPVPFVPPPPATPVGQTLTFISCRTMNYYRDGQKRNHWDFPSHIELEVAGGPANRIPNVFGINVNAPMYGGPVVEINVHVGHYFGTGVTIGDWTGGYLISAMNFVQENDRKRAHLFGDNDSYGYEMRDYKTETWTAPAGHMLVNMSFPSRVKKLWSNRGHGDWSSIGSVMFSCRFKDPTLTPTHRQVAMLYVTSPSELTAEELAHIEADLTGVTRSDTDKKRAVASIDDHKDRHLLQDYRKHYWASLEKRDA
ncbi:insecticidal delta-endotoxin Cry8Ea1 family protein [Dyella sp. 2HG41-7]|uniref:insecticidal delta-endotoxin Cry8Ea1 family protein n=1 Tax=Dyella sp. 2HG41-7 TaxID=2883239 RepID=UPI001F21269A|nr:insecticidal delta-endotoxin Cry8Ea1 family protein [Dyella sp. 2HG41-7]